MYQNVMTERKPENHLSFATISSTKINFVQTEYEISF